MTQIYKRHAVGHLTNGKYVDIIIHASFDADPNVSLKDVMPCYSSKESGPWWTPVEALETSNISEVMGS